MAQTISGVQIFPDDNIWNRTITNAPLHANSANYISSLAGLLLQPDFNAQVTGFDPLGIPINIVNNSTSTSSVTFTASSTSDAGPYPIPASPLIEKPTTSGSDRHCLMLNTDTGTLYEIESLTGSPGSWAGFSGAIWSLASDALRTDTWTSADAAGLPILPGLVRYDEVLTGSINHALRMAIPTTYNNHIWPARHQTALSSNANLPPMGLRLRLKSNFDVSIFSATNQIILNALKTYGVFVADNGSASLYMYGIPDSRWNNSDLANLTMLTATEFEAVDESGAQVSANSGASYPFNIALFPPAVRRGSITSTYDTTIAADGPPIAYYHLTDTIGHPALDSSGNGYHGEVVGGMTPGQAGAIVYDTDAAMLFDGASGNIALPASLSPTGWTALTIEFWIKFTSFSSTFDRRILSDDLTVTDHKGIDIYINHTSGDIICTIGNGTTQANGFTNATYATNTWYHLVFTWNGVVIKSYRNGLDMGTTSGLTGTIAAPTTSFMVGGTSFSNNDFFAGQMQKLSILSNKALSYLTVHRHYLIGMGLLGGTSDTTLFPAAIRRQS